MPPVEDFDRPPQSAQDRSAELLDALLALVRGQGDVDWNRTRPGVCIILSKSCRRVEIHGDTHVTRDPCDALFFQAKREAAEVLVVASI